MSEPSLPSGEAKDMEVATTKWGSCDFEQLKRMQKRLEKLQRVDLDRFCRDAAKELAARLLAMAIPDTPVGVYPPSSGKKGGTLRRGWTAGQQTPGAAYAKTLPVAKTGDTYTVEIVNPVDYASYVEFGHRTRGGKGWVPGQYMLTKAEVRLDGLAPSILERKLQALLKEAFDG